MRKKPLLTPTEQKILGMLARHMTKGEITNELHISNRTVDFHLDNLFGKLGASCQEDAVLIGAEKELVTFVPIPEKPRQEWENFNFKSIEEFKSRQEEVVEFLAGGLLPREMAIWMGIEKRTVDFHLDEIYALLKIQKKTGADEDASRREAMKILRQNGYLPDEPVAPTVIFREGEGAWQSRQQRYRARRRKQGVSVSL